MYLQVAKCPSSPCLFFCSEDLQFQIIALVIIEKAEPKHNIALECLSRIAGSFRKPLHIKSVSKSLTSALGQSGGLEGSRRPECARVENVFTFWRIRKHFWIYVLLLNDRWTTTSEF